MLFATVRQRKIYVKAPQTVVKDGVNVDVLKLEMDDEWAEMTSIICVFSNGSVKKEVMHTFGQPITVPWECLESTGVLMLGITGYVGTQKVMTTMNADNGWEIVQNSETTGDEQFEATPTLTQQLLEAATSANNAAEAANTAKQDILDAVSNGEFDGAPGKDGADGLPGADGYSPSAKVTQTASGAEITITDKDGTTTATVANGKDGVDGKDGSDGKSAYQYAQDGGYTGTEAEFAEKLAAEIPAIDNTLSKAGQAADAAKVGEEISSLSGKIAAIPSGKDGITPTIGENGNWYLGDTDTGKPSRGEPGQDGADGKDGAPGAAGADGHTPVKGTDYFTEADKQEIAEAAAGMVSIPTTLPNPNSLTFTGAVTGSYDGSEPVTINIPSGGGNDKIPIPIMLMDEILTDDTSVEFSDNGNYNELFIVIVCPPGKSVSFNKFSIVFGQGNLLNNILIANPSGNNRAFNAHVIRCEKSDGKSSVFGSYLVANYTNANTISQSNGDVSGQPTYFSGRTSDAYDDGHIFKSNAAIPAGSLVRIYGR